MQIITFGSFKGGSGKTTALMAACSSFIAQGRKVALLEADPNAPLTEWRKNARELGTWDEDCLLLPADELASFEASYAQAERTGIDLVLADTQGAASDLNDSILVNSAVVVIPTALTTLDINAAMETMEYVVKLFMSSKQDVPTAILLQRLPVGKLTVAQNADLAELQSLPMFEARLHHRDAFAALQSRGLLHRYHDRLQAHPARRIEARHLEVAREEADSFAADLLDALA